MIIIYFKNDHQQINSQEQLRIMRPVFRFFFLEMMAMDSTTQYRIQEKYGALHSNKIYFFFKKNKETYSRINIHLATRGT